VAVRFCPTHPVPDIDEEEVFSNGDILTDVVVSTEDLPRGFRTAGFAPFLRAGRYAVQADVQVESGKLLLTPSHTRGQADQADQAQRFSYSLFARGGLRVVVPCYVHPRGFVDVPGLLFPVPGEKEPPHR
jgi:hypothetical protein